MKKTFGFLLSLVCLLSFSVLTAVGQTPTGTEINNKGRFDYKEPVNQNPVQGETNEYKIVVSPINVISVTPDAPLLESIAPNSTNLAPFQVCNEGNATLESLISSVTANLSNLKINRVFWDVDANGYFSGQDVLITINSTQLSIPTGKCLPIIVEFETGSIAPGTSFPITLTASALGPNSNGSDSGDRRYQLNRGAVFQYEKRVNGQIEVNAQIGEVVSYELKIANNGDATARELVLSDVIQGGSYVSNSLKINDIAKTDAVDADEAEMVVNRLSARVSTLPVGEAVRVNFQVQVTSLPNGSSIPNVGSLISPSISNPIPSNFTQVVVNPKGLVFNGEIGINALIPNSLISLVDEQGIAVSLVNELSFPANPGNSNPFTSSNGEYAFGLPCLGATYVLTTSADGFVSRRIEVNVSSLAGLSLPPSPTSPCTLSYSLKALDGLPLANGLDGSLSGSSVTSSNMAGLFAFIPMFKAGAISVNKSVDRAMAQTGDILEYRVDFTNNSNAVASEVQLQDTLPRGFYLIENSMELVRNGSRSALAYQQNGNLVTASLGSIPAHQTVSVFYKVRIGADAAKGANTNIVIATDPDKKPISNSGTAKVEVRYGLESEKQVLIGRVFVDKNKDGIFNLRDSDLPIANAQVCTSQGKCALTDSEGKYSIPTTPAGKIAVGLIRNTIGDGLLPKYHKTESPYDGDWSQLVRSPLGVGMLQTANFPLIESRESGVESEESKAEQAVREMTLPEYLQIVGAELPSKSNVQIVVKSVQTGKSAISAAVQVRNGNIVKLFLNGEEVPENTIGERINQGSTLTLVYYNLNLQVGENKLEAVSYNQSGEETGRDEKDVTKGGKAVKFAILPEKSETAAGGRNEVEVRIIAFDENGNPAEDSEVMLTASNGTFRTEKEVSQNAVTISQNANQKAQIGSNQQIVKLYNGSGKVKLTSPIVAAKSDIYLSNGYGAVNNQNALAVAQINFAEPTPVPTVIGFGELYWGEANPSILQMGKENTFFAGRASLFGRAPLFKGVFTGSYQSNLPLNRDESFDKNLVNRLSFNNFNFDEGYSIFGDSSQRFALTPSNTKAFARWEKALNFVQFGDFSGRQKSNSNGLFAENSQFFRLRQNSNQALEADSAPKLSAYNRNLTGLQIHLEDKKGNLFEIAGARPDTAFGRDLIAPSGLSRIKLSANDILFGTETISVETRDRRAPERIVKKETLIRDVDYEIDYLTGVVFLKSNISLFDLELNPNQLVVSYEHKADKTSNVILARGEKTLENGKYRFGGTFNYTSQAGTKSYALGGFDFRAKLPNNGLVEFEIARSQGQPLGFGNNFSNEDTTGYAVLANWQQRFNRWKTNVNFVTAQNGFNNPYGGIIQRGSTRLLGQAEYAATSKDNFRFQAGFDRTATENFNNHRETFGMAWKRSWNDKFSTLLGYDFRNFADNSNQYGDKQSHLVTAGLNWNPTNKLSFSVVREQNLSNENDPAYPNNTILQAEYRINQWSKFFATNRFGGQINPIGDSSQIVAYQSKREFTSGFETKFKQGTSLMSAYRNEDGLNGQESFAVTGIGQKFNFKKNWSTDFGYSFAWKLAGESLVSKQSTYHNAFGGVTYAKENAFTANARYEYRNRLGNANLFSAGIAGKVNQDWTMLGKFSFAQADQTFDKSFRKSVYGQFAGAYRPKETDRYGMLFSYQFRDYGFRQTESFQAKRDANHFASVDGFYQPNAKWSVFAKGGIRYVAQEENKRLYSTLMSLVQSRAEYRFDKYFDFGAEARWINEFKTNSNRFGAAAEVGFWATPELRISGGYNFQQRSSAIFATDKKQGFYLTITTKLDRYFKIFGSNKASGTK